MYTRRSPTQQRTQPVSLQPVYPAVLRAAGAVLAAGLLGAFNAPAAQTGPTEAGTTDGAAVQTKPPGGTEVPAFPIVEEIDRREKELKEKQFRQKRQHQYNDIQRLVQLAQQQDADEQIRMLLRAERLLRDMQAVRAEASIAQGIRHVQKAILLVPPPAAYRNRVGLEMILVTSSDPPFYASKAPVSRDTLAAFLAETGETAPATTAPSDSQAATGVTWLTAKSFCTWLSEKTATPYALPTLEQLRQLPPQSGRAFWTSTAWDGPTQDVAKTRTRYGVEMFTILDPDKTLASGEVLADLPFARFDTVGFSVVTPVASGVSQRLKRLRSEK